MNRLFAAILLALSFSAAAERPARVTVLEGDNLAQNIVAASVREEVAAGDARVKQARAWLDKAVAITGEEEKAVAAFSERTARWFFDISRSKATSLEMLEALALLAKPGTTMNDTLRGYIEARRAAAGKSHAEALKALGAAR